MTTAAQDVTLSIAGVRVSTTWADIRQTGDKTKDDLLLVELAEGNRTVGVFTQNQFCAAPVTLAKQQMQQTQARALLINSGNANAATGAKGLQIAKQLCSDMALHLDCLPEEVVPFSTGVIGEQLPHEQISASFGELVEGLSHQGWVQAAFAILTTDTRHKLYHETFEIEGQEVNLLGIAKGSGMIHPNMATMLSFVFTDVPIAVDTLNSFLAAAVEDSFNCISVDGDTSTNDACTLSATGKANIAEIDNPDSESGKIFYHHFQKLMQRLAQSIVRDGEGATKFITLNITGADTRKEARAVTESIANSPLVKTAMFASDPNWGRLIMAIGKSGIDALDTNRVQISFDDLLVFKDGQVNPNYTEEAAAKILERPEFSIHIDLNRGTESITFWTTDMSHDYVTINAEYRT